MKTLTFTLTVDIEPWFDHEKTDDEWIEYLTEHLITDAHVIGPDDELTEVNGYELTLPKNDMLARLFNHLEHMDDEVGSKMVEELLTAHGQNTEKG
jgi:hypothetical protein